MLAALVLAALALYFAVAWQAYQHPLQGSPWNDRWAVIAAVSCAGIAVLPWVRRAGLQAWLAVGAVLALLIAVGFLGGAATALLTFIWIAPLALATGDAILAVVAKDIPWDASERLLYGWVVGIAAIGFAVFALAFGGWLYREIALGLLIAGSATALLWWRRDNRGARLTPRHDMLDTCLQSSVAERGVGTLPARLRR